MSETLFNSGNRSQEEQDSLEMTEAAREKKWELPSFTADLLMGKLRVGDLFPYPDQSEEDAKIGKEYLEKLKIFLEKNVDGIQVDREKKIPDAVMKGLAELGAFGMKIPKEYGGLGLSQLNYCRALELVNRYCASTAATLSAHQSIGVPQPLMLFGTEAQKKKFLPKIAAGAISAFALTEVEVGSDPAKMKTFAEPTEDGESYILNGTKLWCSNGVIADYIVVMARTPSITVEGKEKKQISAFIVEKGMPGFEVLHRCSFMGANGLQNGVLSFKNVKVPKENLIWDLGKGLRLALITLNAGRLSMPAIATGTARECLKIAREWSQKRTQWGTAIGNHEAVSEKLATMSARLYAMDTMTTLLCHWVDQKSHDIRLEAAIAKVLCSQHCTFIVNETLQIRGGRGYETAESLKNRGETPIPIEQVYRDNRINEIVEGTSEILRLFVSREGLDRHLEIGGDILNSKLDRDLRIKAGIKATRFYAKWYSIQWLRPLWNWLNFPRYQKLGPLGKHLRFVENESHRLARTIFHLMILHGPKLEKRQLQLTRVVDIAAELFAMSTTISDAKKNYKEKPGAGPLADLYCRQAREKIHKIYLDLWCAPDKKVRKVAKGILSDKYPWLEETR